MASCATQQMHPDALRDKLVVQYLEDDLLGSRHLRLHLLRQQLVLHPGSKVLPAYWWGGGHAQGGWAFRNGGFRLAGERGARGARG